jgi:hypothetical protein
MTQENYILEALDIVSNWIEVPDDRLSDAIDAQSKFMAGICQEDFDDRSDIH